MPTDPMDPVSALRSALAVLGGAILGGVIIGLGSLAVLLVVQAFDESPSMGRSFYASAPFGGGLVIALIVAGRARGRVALFGSLLAPNPDRDVLGSPVWRRWLGDLWFLLGNTIGASAVAGLSLLAGIHSLGDGRAGLYQLSVAQNMLGSGAHRYLYWGALAGIAMRAVHRNGPVPRPRPDFKPPHWVPAVVMAILVFSGVWHAGVAFFYFVSGLLVKLLAPAAFWVSIGSAPEAFVDLMPGPFLLRTFLPAALGMLIGTYWADLLKYSPRTKRPLF